MSFRLTTELVNSPVFNNVSVSGDGQYAMMGQLLVNRRLRIVADTPEAVDSAEGLVGSQAIDSEIDTVYVSFDTASEFQTGEDEHPVSGVLQMMDLDNLLVRKRIRIAQRLTGPIALDSSGETMYGVSESGLLYMPLNRLSEEPQLEFHPDDRVIFEQFDSCRRLPACTPFVWRAPAAARLSSSCRSTTSAAVDARPCCLSPMSALLQPT